ncbi:MAG: threonine synthase [Christensenellaceae bacterium]|jgi:threonine synthase|nr:threonine synthase [Christensenellaceae bacterium]
MKFVSTRGKSPAVSASQAILNGIAPDGGLYVPEEFPALSKDDLETLQTMTYAERAAYIISLYLTDYSYKDLEVYTKKAYSLFDGEDAAHIKLIEDDLYLMNLWHGPTQAFKDAALTLLPFLLTGARKITDAPGKTLILVATSGDTGKAALEGFKNVDGTEIIVFYPADGVSDMQKLQMQTTTGDNVHVIGINGNFDDAQTAVKLFFKDADAAAKCAEQGYYLSSANSINFGRLVPQIVYYISAYLDIVAGDEGVDGEEINFVVPTGNFGNVLAGYYAKKMGLPINKLIVASNSNSVLTDFFALGRYDTNRPFIKTISPSMDILISSNLERLLFEYNERNGGKTADLMSRLDVQGLYNVDIDDFIDKLPEFAAFSTDEDETKQTIESFFDMTGELIDPHTAVAVSAFYNYCESASDKNKTVVVSTASPYKFPQDVLTALTGKGGKDAFDAVKKLHSYTDEPVPKPIAALKTLPVLHTAVIDKTKTKEAIFEILANRSNRA